MFVGQALGQPVLLSYVETGSMAPTIPPGEGFVAIPAALAGPIERGDVVTFRAESVGGGGLTTHRVVGERNGGFVTQGDANPFTDQAGGEPPVSHARIVAVALSVNGEVVTIPALGAVATTLRDGLDGVARPIAATTGIAVPAARSVAAFGIAAVAALLIDDDADGPEREADRESGLRGSQVALLVAAAVALAATAAMALPAGTHAYDVVSAEQDAPGPRVIAAGSDETTNYTVANGGLVPVVSYLSGGEGVTVSEERVRVAGGSARNASATLSVPDETGLYRRTLTEDRYLAILPGGLLDALHGVHPAAPIAVIDLLLGSLAYGGVYGALGGGRAKSRDARKSRGIGRRLRRWL